MPVIKAFDLAYGRLRSPDLDKQEEFLTDFGMVRAERTKKCCSDAIAHAVSDVHSPQLTALYNSKTRNKVTRTAMSQY